MVREMVRKYAESHIKPIAAELDRTHRHPEEICRQLGEMGLMGVAVPTEYDGAGMDNVTYVMALIEIAKACASCGVITSVTTASPVASRAMARSSSPLSLRPWKE